MININVHKWMRVEYDGNHKSQLDSNQSYLNYIFYPISYIFYKLTDSYIVYSNVTLRTKQLKLRTGKCKIIPRHKF